MPKDQPSLPSARAFVVQFHADARPEQGDFKGRVEHLSSYTAEHFTSAEALMAFMARILSTPQPAGD